MVIYEWQFKSKFTLRHANEFIIVINIYFKEIITYAKVTKNWIKIIYGAYNFKQCVVSVCISVDVTVFPVLIGNDVVNLWQQLMPSLLNFPDI